MKASMLVPSKFMDSIEFGVGAVPREPLVTIDDAKLEKQDSKETWGLLYFREKWAKPLKMNKTHLRAMVLMFGDETEGWKGKRIGLYVFNGKYSAEHPTAVRISGSPDLKTAKSFSVRRFGGGKDKYELRVLSADGAFDAALYVPFGKSVGQRYEDLEVAEITAAIVEFEQQLNSPAAKKTPAPRWVARASTALTCLAAERDKRLVAAVPDAGTPPADDHAPPEPGSDL